MCDVAARAEDAATEACWGRRPRTIAITGRGLMRRVASLVLACAAAVVVPRAAHACGGFFCRQVPVDQSGEQILFSIDGTHVTAHIQISYQGDAKDFAWVVPVALKPTISLGNKMVFQQLMSHTSP